MRTEPEIKIGDWVVVRRDHCWDMHPTVKQVTKVTNKTVHVPFILGEKAVKRLNVMAVFDNEEGAVKLLHKISSIRGERDRRVSCAHSWAAKQVLEAIEKSTAPAPDDDAATNGDDSHVG